MSTNATASSPARSRTPAHSPRNPRLRPDFRGPGLRNPDANAGWLGWGWRLEMTSEMKWSATAATVVSPAEASAITRWLAFGEAVQHGVRQPRREVGGEVVVEHRVASTPTPAAPGRRARRADRRRRRWLVRTGGRAGAGCRRRSRRSPLATAPSCTAPGTPNDRPPTAARPTGGSCPRRTSACRDRRVRASAPRRRGG